MRIGILEDDLALAAHVEKSLAAADHACDHFIDGQLLLRALRRDTFDILILDWNVPGLSGREVIQWMKENLVNPPPAIMLTSRSAEEDIVAGLNAGADDYVIKPVPVAVLLARVDALARRAYPPAPDRIEIFGDYRFDSGTGTLNIAGEMVNLTAKEFALALMLFRNRHRALSRTYLFDALWGCNPDLPTRTLDVHISNVRTKLNLRPSNGYKLAPIYAYGYRLEVLN
jgi:DNA-binding response OmpR family regulator